MSVVNQTTITVTSATDAALRNALNTANTDTAAGEAATILFAANLAGDTIKLSQGPLELMAGTGVLTIEGGGLITLSGDGKSSVFLIDSGAQATLDGLTIEDGNAGSGSGGGIDNAGTLIINNSTLANNTASVSGGGIENTGSLTVTNITVTGNSASANGGGIDNAGTLMILDASLSGNSAAGNNGTGGGIANSGTLTLINSTLTDNSATVVGGGIYNAGLMTVTGSTIDDNTGSYIAGGINNVGTMTVANSTLTGNFAYLGGGIYNGNYYGLSGTLTLSNDTITSNFAAYGAGGGIYMANGTYSSTGGSTLTLLNSLVAGNFASGNSSDPLSNPDLPFGPDIQVYSGTVTGSNNLIGDGQGLTGISNGDANHNQVGTPAAPIDALLAAPINDSHFTQTLTSPVVLFNQSEIPLASNGGPTQTIALLNGSPAIGAGGAITTLTGPLINGSNSIPVADAAAIASTPGQYFILIDGEEMEVTNVNLANNDLTVIRAINGITATLQSNDPVYLFNDQRGFARATPSDIGAYQSGAMAITVPTVTGISPAVATTLGGTQVTIEGVNLAGTTAVSFGTNPATIVSVSPDLVLVISPAGAMGTVDVTVTTPGGTSATSAADQFTYEAVPTVTGIGPATGLPGGGTGVVITGTNLLGATTVDFGANPATIFSASLTQLVVINPAGAVGTVDVTVTTPSGTSAKSSADQFTYVAATSPIEVTTNSDDLVHTGISLRDAIAQANSDAGLGISDTILFSSNLNGDTITLAQGATGQLILSGQGTGIITIDGGGYITISGANTSSVFQIDSGVDAVLTGLTMVDGNAGSNGEGGAIHNAGILSMLNDTLSNDTANIGGAIDNTGTLTLMNSTLSNNTANNGGAIANVLAGRMTVTGSTFSGNTGSYIGGAIDNQAVMTVTNSTLVNNNSYLGGAINNGNQYGNGGTLTLTSDTLTGNMVTGNGGGIYMENGGYDPKPSTLTLHNTIVAGNTADQPGPDVFVSSGSLSGAYNLIGIGTGLSGISNNTNGNQIGTSASPLDPQLSALANNGGPTQTSPSAQQPGHRWRQRCHHACRRRHHRQGHDHHGRQRRRHRRDQSRCWCWLRPRDRQRSNARHRRFWQHVYRGARVSWHQGKYPRQGRQRFLRRRSAWPDRPNHHSRPRRFPNLKSPGRDEESDQPHGRRRPNHHLHRRGSRCEYHRSMAGQREWRHELEQYPRRNDQDRRHREWSSHHNHDSVFRHNTGNERPLVPRLPQELHGQHLHQPSHVERQSRAGSRQREQGPMGREPARIYRHLDDQRRNRALFDQDLGRPAHGAGSIAQR